MAKYPNMEATTPISAPLDGNAIGGISSFVFLAIILAVVSSKTVGNRRGIFEASSWYKSANTVEI